MAENRIEIMLEMIDNASPEFKRMNAETISQVKKLEQNTSQSFEKIEKSSKKTTNALKDFSDKIREMRTALVGVTLVMAAAIASVNELAKYDREAKNTMDDFKKSASGLASELGVVLQPAIQATTQIVEYLTVGITAATAGFIKAFSFMSEIMTNSSWNPLRAVDDIKNAMEIANSAADEYIDQQVELRARVQTGQSLDVENKTMEMAAKNQTLILKKELVARAALRQADVQNQMAVMNFASEMTTMLAGESKAAFYIMKAVKSAEIMINSAAADMTIAATWAWNPPVMASLIAQNKLLTGISLATVAATAIAGSFAAGAASIPQDMVAQIHRNEMIVPATFSESIRRGDLTLSGGAGGSFGDINIFIQGGINPGGSSIEEMAEKLGFAFEREVRTARG